MVVRGSSWLCAQESSLMTWRTRWYHGKKQGCCMLDRHLSPCYSLSILKLDFVPESPPPRKGQLWLGKGLVGLSIPKTTP